MPSRRVAIAAALRGAFLLAAAPAAAVAAPAALPAPVEQLFQRWERATARWRAAEAAANAADKRYVEDFFPSALFLREDDDRQLRACWDRCEYHAGGRRCFGPFAIEELREQMAAYDRGEIYIGGAGMRRAVARRRELIAAGEWWGVQEEEASRATGRDAAFLESDAAMAACSNIMHEVIASRDNSAGALAVRLAIFATCWEWEYPDTPLADGDRLDDAIFEENVALQAAVRVALNLSMLIRRAAADADSHLEGNCGGAVRSLGEIASSVLASLPAETRS
jgi:hypothetical protein